MIHLSQEEYIELLRAQEKLKCLEVGGVDEWRDYYEVMGNYVDPAGRIKIEAQAKEILDFLASCADVEQYPVGPGTGWDICFDNEAQEAIVIARWEVSVKAHNKVIVKSSNCHEIVLEDFSVGIVGEHEDFGRPDVVVGSENARVIEY